MLLHEHIRLLGTSARVLAESQVRIKQAVVLGMMEHRLDGLLPPHKEEKALVHRAPCIFSSLPYPQIPNV